MMGLTKKKIQLHPRSRFWLCLKSIKMQRVFVISMVVTSLGFCRLCRICVKNSGRTWNEPGIGWWVCWMLWQRSSTTSPSTTIRTGCTKWWRSAPTSWPWSGLYTDSIISLFSFFVKIIDLPGGKINDPSPGKYYSLLFLLATTSCLPRTLEGLFELTQSPSRAVYSPHALLTKLQRNKDDVRSGKLGAEVPGHGKKLLMQTLIVRLLKTHFFTPIPDNEKSTE